MKHHIIYRISHILCIVLCLSACNEETFIDMTSQELSPLQFYTSSANTRTSLFDDGTTVVWSEKDELAVYDYETSKHRFVSEHIDGASALFEGKITKQKENFLALYPYELGAEKLSENQEIIAALPHKQTAVENTFAPNLNISVAKGARNIDGSPSNITFHNVCQLLKFTVPAYAADKIKQITFTADVPLAGNLYVDYSDDMPTATIATDGEKSITIVAPTGNATFTAGTYYIVSAPVELRGFTMTFTCDNNIYTLSSSSTFGGQAGKVYNLGNIDLVNTPLVTAKHQYADGLLQGTLLTVANPPIDGSEWKAVVKNAAGTIVRTMQGVGMLTSSEQDEHWPYLLRGNYSLDYTFTTSNGKEITKSQNFNLNEKPELSVTVTAHTSYSYYKGDGVTRDIPAANTCEPYKIYAPVVKINGAAPRLLANVNYSFIVSNNFNGNLTNNTDGTYIYDDYTIDAYGEYTLIGNVTFDGMTLTGEKKVHITGLPYETTPPTQNDWTGNAKEWNSSYVRLQKESTITKSFYCPEDINVRVEHDVRVRRHTENTTYQLICSGISLMSLKGGSVQSTVTDNGSYTGVLSSSNPTVSCYNSFGQADIWPLEGTNAQVSKIKVEYR